MQKLRYSELVRVSWLIVWRGAVGGVIFGATAMTVLTLGILGILSTVGLPENWIRHVLSWLAVLIYPLLMFPVILQMVLGKEFRGFRIQVLRPDESIDSLSFRESLRPAWTLFWMSNVIGFLPLYLLLFLASFILSVFGQVYQIDVTTMWIGFFAYATLVVYPLIVTLLLRKKYRTFRFDLERGPGISKTDLAGSGKTLALGTD